MQILKLVLSQEAPNVKDALWLKPVEGGFTLYALFDGEWKTLQLMDDNSTAQLADDIVADTTKKVKSSLIGSVQDKKTANTINGAKAFATSAAEAVVGTAEDTKTDMTLYGLKAYIDDALNE